MSRYISQEKLSVSIRLMKLPDFSMMMLYTFLKLFDISAFSLRIYLRRASPFGLFMKAFNDFLVADRSLLVGLSKNRMLR